MVQQRREGEVIEDVVGLDFIPQAAETPWKSQRWVTSESYFRKVTLVVVQMKNLEKQREKRDGTERQGDNSESVEAIQIKNVKDPI